MSATTILILGRKDSTREITALLGELGYTVAAATEKIPEPPAIERLRPRLILCDCTGDSAGWAESVRHLPARCKLPVILCLPAADLDTLPETIFDDGCSYILKPLAKDDLRLRLEQTLAADRRRHQSEKLLDCAETVASMGHWRYHPHQDLLLWSPGVYRILGLDPQLTVADRTMLLSLVHAEDRRMVEEYYREAPEKGGKASISYRIVRSDGTCRFVREQCLLLQEEGQGPAVPAGVLQDLTEQRRTEEALERRGAEMDQFAHIASHDLQEPLRAINGFMQLLQSRYRDRLDDKGREFIDRSINAGRRMEQLIKELLQLARISSRGGPFEEENMDTVLGEATDRLGVLLRETGGEIVGAPLPRLPVDRKQMATLFYHLLANGLRYNTSTSPRVEIDWKQQDSMYHFRVRDNGIGIAAEFQQRIFEVFQRLHTQREYPGVGMGLTHAKKIVERHGGIIWVESEPEKGAAFHFTLPATRR